jgi:uncharacterized protein
MAVSEELIPLLACPVCKGALTEAEHSLLCAACRLKFPVREGIPVLLVEEAEPIS